MEDGGPYTVSGCYRLFQLTLARTIEELSVGTAMDNFKADFKRKIAGLLTGVTADRIAITDVSAASVVVSFYIGPGPQGCPSTACAPSGQAMEEMLQLADDAAALDRAFPSSFEGLSPAPLLAGRAPPPAPSTSTSDSQLEAEEGSGAVVALIVVMVVLCGGGGGFVVKDAMKNRRGQASPAPAGSEIELDMDGTSETTENPVSSMRSGAGKPKTLWKEIQDPASGKPYWVHRETRETSWKKPADADQPWGGGGGGEADGAAGGTYTEHVDAKGRTYYSEVATRKTVWKLPAGAVLVDPKGALEV